MSERDEIKPEQLYTGGLICLVFLVVVILFLIVSDHTEMRDLQRRVAQLESTKPQP